MKAIKRECTYTQTRYIAEDGREFNSARECETYEKEIARENIDVSHMECKAAEGLPNFGIDYTTDDYGYTWYKVESNDDIDMLQEKFSLDDYDVRSIKPGDYVCIEETFDCNNATTLDSGLAYVENLLDKLGFEIEVRPKKN